MYLQLLITICDEFLPPVYRGATAGYRRLPLATASYRWLTPVYSRGIDWRQPAVAGGRRRWRADTAGYCQLPPDDASLPRASAGLPPAAASNLDFK